MHASSISDSGSSSGPDSGSESGPQPGVLTSPLLERHGFRHAFFTREGGASVGPFRSLNFSAAVGDEASAVAANLARARRYLGVDEGKLCFVSQVHGVATALVDGTASPGDLLKLEADAVLTRARGVACAVRTADCVPVLLADVEAGTVAAVHAGWRGVVAGAVEAALGRLRALSAGGGEWVAAVGPHISVSAFEVSEEVADELQASCPVPIVSREYGDRPHVDLRRAVRAQLVSAGLADGDVDDVRGCTVLDAERFFSYRRDGARSGRHLSAIVCGSR